MSSLNSYLNTAVDNSINVVRESVYTIPHFAVGGLCSLATGAGFAGGAIQGAFTRAFRAWVIKPFDAYVDENERKTKDNLHPSTAWIMRRVSLVAEIAIPILLTLYTGNVILSGARWIAPTVIKGIFSTSLQNYTFLRATLIYTTVVFGVEILAPAIAESIKDVKTQLSSRPKSTVSPK